MSWTQEVIKWKSLIAYYQKKFKKLVLQRDWIMTGKIAKRKDEIYTDKELGLCKMVFPIMRILKL